MTTCNSTRSSAIMACEGVRCIVCQISGHVHRRKVEKESRWMFVALSRLMLIYAAYCDIYPHLQRAFSICDRHSGALHSPVTRAALHGARSGVLSSRQPPLTAMANHLASAPTQSSKAVRMHVSLLRRRYIAVQMFEENQGTDLN
jgi:hypothetical protein